MFCCQEIFVQVYVISFLDGYGNVLFILGH